MSKKKRTFEQTKRDIGLLSGSKRERAEALLTKAEFMHEQLEYLQDQIKTNGIIEEYNNGGGQSGLKKSTYIDVYNTLIRNFNTTLNQLNGLMPEVGAGDEIEAFLNGK